MVAPLPVNHKPLTRSDAEALLPLARAGDEAAASRLIAGVSAFIGRIAKKYARRVPGADVDDLAQAGLIAASQSIAGYDPSRGTAAWTSYAMTAAARGIAREAAKAKQLQCRFPTPDPGTEVNPEMIPEAVSAWDPGETGEVATVRDALFDLEPIERAAVEYSHGLTGEYLEGHSLACRLGVRSRKLAGFLLSVNCKLRVALEKRGLSKALVEE